MKSWAIGCIQYQRAKVGRHVHVQPAHFPLPSARFKHVHMDIIGPLPECERYRYCLTLVDRFSRWPEAIPLKNITAQAVARAFTDNWITCFGSPEPLSTDQGAQFEARLFTGLQRVIGCDRTRITAYHPASNGFVERSHRTLKAAIMCHSGSEWLHVLSTVLLGLRIYVTDNGASPAEYVYGTTLRIPGELIVPEDESVDPRHFLSEFRRHMHQVRAVPVERHNREKVFVHKELKTCTHVFLLAPPNKRSLQCPYTGPHKIINRISDKVLEIDVNGKNKNVSVENVKPAHFIPHDEWIAIRNTENDKPTSENINVKISNKIGPALIGQPILNIEKYASRIVNNNQRDNKVNETQYPQETIGSLENANRLNEQCISKHNVNDNNKDRSKTSKMITSPNSQIEKHVRFASSRTINTKTINI